MITSLEAYRSTVTQYLAELAPHRETRRSAGTLHQRLSLEHGIASYEGQLRWIEHAVAELRPRGKDRK